jgi:hypothetical protein
MRRRRDASATRTSSNKSQSFVVAILAMMGVDSAISPNSAMYGGGERLHDRDFAVVASPRPWAAKLSFS